MTGYYSDIPRTHQEIPFSPISPKEPPRKRLKAATPPSPPPIPSRASVAKAEEVIEQHPMTKEAAVKFIQARVRGKQTRDRTVLPRQVAQFLREKLHLPENEDTKIICIALCRAMNDSVSRGEDSLVKKGTKIEVTNVPRSAQDKEKKRGIDEPIVVLDDKASGKSTLEMPYWFKIELSKDRSSVHLSVDLSEDGETFEKQKTGKTLLGFGGYKDTFKAQTLSVRLKLVDKERKTAQTRIAWQQTSNDTSRIAQKNKLYRQLYRQVKQLGGELIDPPREVVAGHAYIQDRYRQLKKDDASPVTDAASAPVLLDVLEDLHFIHQAGYVHRDVKPHNMLADERGAGYIIDFDFLQPPGGNFTQNEDYEYWDSCSREGIVTPFTDLYGWAISVGKCSQHLTGQDAIRFAQYRQAILAFNEKFRGKLDKIIAEKRTTGELNDNLLKTAYVMFRMNGNELKEKFLDHVSRLSNPRERRAIREAFLQNWDPLFAYSTRGTKTPQQLLEERFEQIKQLLLGMNVRESQINQIKPLFMQELNARISRFNEHTAPTRDAADRAASLRWIVGIIMAIRIPDHPLTKDITSKLNQFCAEKGFTARHFLQAEGRHLPPSPA